MKDRHDIDLLFCDVIMPGRPDGYQLASAAHKMHPDLRTLLTSGFTKKREQILKGEGEGEFLQYLTSTFLNKPYNDAELAFAVRRTLDGDHGGDIEAI